MKVPVLDTAPGVHIHNTHLHTYTIDALYIYTPHYCVCTFETRKLLISCVDFLIPCVFHLQILDK